MRFPKGCVHRAVLCVLVDHRVWGIHYPRVVYCSTVHLIFTVEIKHVMCYVRMFISVLCNVQTRLFPSNTFPSLLVWPVYN